MKTHYLQICLKSCHQRSRQTTTNKYVPKFSTIHPTKKKKKKKEKEKQQTIYVRRWEFLFVVGKLITRQRKPRCNRRTWSKDGRQWRRGRRQQQRAGQRGRRRAGWIVDRGWSRFTRLTWTSMVGVSAVGWQRVNFEETGARRLCDSMFELCAGWSS